MTTRTAPRVAVVNREFARKIFGSVTNAIGRYFKLPDGTRIQVVGIVEDGKYTSLTEDPQPAMFLPILQSPSSATWLVVRSNRDPQQLARSHRGASCGAGCRAARLHPDLEQGTGRELCLLRAWRRCRWACWA